MLQNKKILIFGVINARSIAAGIATSMRKNGATIGLVCQNERIAEKADAVAKQCECDFNLTCDVSDDSQISALFEDVKKRWGQVDGIIHSIAFAPREALTENYLDGLSRDAFLMAHDISSYSLTGIVNTFLPILSKGSCVTALTYLGGERVIPKYNVMGVAKASLEMNIRYLADALGEKEIRVNGISAGPVRTLASAGIQDFAKMLAFSEKISPMKRNVGLSEIGDVATFLGSSMASAVTGEIIHVDTGLHLLGPRPAE